MLGTSGDRAFTERLTAQPGQQQVVYGAQIYDCAIVMALAVAVAGSTDPVVYGAEMRGVTQGGRTCSSYGDCLALLRAGEDIDYDGPSGRMGLDERGDITSVRFTVAGSRTAAWWSGVRGRRLHRASPQRSVHGRGVRDPVAASAAGPRLLRGRDHRDVRRGHRGGAARPAPRPRGTRDGRVRRGDRCRPARPCSAPSGAASPPAVAEIQQLLTDLGYYTGPVDGVFTTEARPTPSGPCSAPSVSPRPGSDRRRHAPGDLRRRGSASADVDPAAPTDTTVADTTRPRRRRRRRPGRGAPTPPRHQRRDDAGDHGDPETSARAPDHRATTPAPPRRATTEEPVTTTDEATTTTEANRSPSRNPSRRPTATSGPCSPATPVVGGLALLRDRLRRGPP